MHLFNLKIKLEINNLNISIYKDIIVEVTRQTRIYQLKELLLSKFNFHTHFLQQLAFHENGNVKLLINEDLIPLSFLQNRHIINAVVVPIYLN